MLSDDSTSDSDTGIRFKTESTRRPTRKEEDVKNKTGGNHRSDSSRRRDSGKSYSSRNVSPRRDKSPIREIKYSKDRNKLDFNRHRVSNHDRERGNRENVSSRDSNHKYQSTRSEDKRKSDDRKLHERGERFSIKVGKNDNEKSKNAESSKSRNSNVDGKIRLAPRKSSGKDNDDGSHVRSSINRNVNASKTDKNGPDRGGDHPGDYQTLPRFDQSKKSDVDILDQSQKIVSLESSPSRLKRSIVREQIEVEKRPRKDEETPEVVYTVDDIRISDTSDTEQRPVSYYNMVSTDYKNKTQELAKEEAIAVSDSSEDEDALRKQLLLLEEELKKTKGKKKSKHKDRKRVRRDSKSQLDETVMSSNSENFSKYDTLSDDNAADKTSTSTMHSFEHKVDSHRQNKSVGKKKCDESNEEGEIVSDSDEKHVNSDLRDRLGKHRKISSVDSKPQMPDLREHLSSVSRTSHSSNNVESNVDEIEDAVEGPALPPHMMKNTNTPKNIGPSLPDDMRQRLLENSDRLSGDRSLDEDLQSSDGEDVLGPMPQGSEMKWSNSHKRLEERALKMKINSLDGDLVEKSQRESREEWMLKLPDAKAKHLGLTSRQFRSREGPDLSDRSSWTDTPEQKTLKALGIQTDNEEADSQNLLRNAKLEFIQQRDAEQELVARKHKKKSKRKESLLELHEKKLKKKKKKEDKDKDEPTRRPFDRDIDLKANRFDEAQKKIIIKKAQLLDTRFSKGESKFL
ncbi:uncharacterized protein LOC143916306 isoform X2 [Arctopsyche grandis]|uniref:uncharacterized protein LOC143916306 isoform X2 n=1 Tax=Arctopsyche grandis TaxID=121162 RepID=UPI00406D8541